MKVEYQPWFNAISCLAVKPIIKHDASEWQFAFKFPTKFSQQQAFLEDKEKATVRVYFFENNLAKIAADDSVREVTWLVAYNQIANATFGMRVLPCFIDVNTVVPSVKENEKSLQSWMDAFDKIPHVQTILASTTEGGLFDVCIPTSLAEVADKDHVYALYDPCISIGLDEKTGTQITTWNIGTKNTLLQKYAVMKAPDNNVWEHCLRTVIAYVKELTSMIPNYEEKERGLSEAIKSAAEIGAQIQRFKDRIKERFSTIGVNIDDNSDDDKVFVVDFPVSLYGIENNDQAGHVFFRGNGTASFDIDSDDHQGALGSVLFEPIEKLLYEDILWQEAYDLLDTFLTALSKVVPEKVE